MFVTFSGYDNILFFADVISNIQTGALEGLCSVIEAFSEI